MPLTRAQAYTEAGVNIDAGNSLVSRIKSIVSQTHIHGVLSDIGGDAPFTNKLGIRVGMTVGSCNVSSKLF